MTRVTFGIRSSQHHAIRALREVAEGKSLIDEIILSNSYVDEFLTGAESIAEAKQLQSQLPERLLGDGFPLRNWSSSVEILKVLHPDLLETKDVLELGKKQNSIKALGVVWHPATYVFCFHYNG